jgi:hypothetical protein
MIPPPAIVVHEVDGRLRVRIATRRLNQRYFEAAAEALRRCGGVDAVIANPLTGSLLILHHASRSAIEAFAEERGVFTVTALELPDIPSDRVASAVDAITTRFDQAISRSTYDTGDLRTIAFLTLAALAVVQFVRGNALPPAITLVTYAMGVLPRGDEQSSGGTANDEPARRVPEDASRA